MQDSREDPVLGFGDFCKEVVVVRRVLEVRLEAERQLEQPLPLGLHGSKVRLHSVAGRVMRHHQLVATILYAAELVLPLLKFTHQSLGNMENGNI